MNATLNLGALARILVLLACLCSLQGCGALVTADDLAAYRKAEAEKDDAIGRATRAYVENQITAQQHADAIKTAQEKPDAVAEATQQNPSIADEWGDFALALGKTLGVPALITGIGGVALDKIRDRRRKQRGEPVDTDGDGVPDAEDDAPLDPSKGAQPVPVT